MHEHIPDSASTYIMVDVHDLKAAGFYLAMGVMFVWSSHIIWKRDIQPLIKSRAEQKLRAQTVK